MKKSMALLVMVLISLTLLNADQGRWKFSLGAGAFMPRSAGYKDVYGSSVFYPQANLSFNLAGKFHLQAGYGYFSAKGETTGELALPTKSKQNHLTFMAVFEDSISEKFFFQLGAGTGYISYKEEAMDTEISGNGLGFTWSGGIGFKVSKTIFIMAKLGCLSAGDKPEGVEEKLQLGGFAAGISLGINF